MTTSNVVLLAINAKYSHTSLAVRYLREACRDIVQAEIIEMTINQPALSIVRAIHARAPRILCVACYIWNIELVQTLLPLIAKALPHTIVICGGPEVSYETRAFLTSMPAVHYVVRGEGEEATRCLLTRLLFETSEPVETIAGVSGRRADGTLFDADAVTVRDLARLPFPYTDDEMPALTDRILYYETSRGCPFSCAYCLSCATAGVREMDTARVLRELAFFARHNVRQVKFVDRTFNARASHFMPILRYIRDLPATCRTNFHFELAADILQDDAVALLRTMPAHRVQLEIGIQSTNPATLRAVRRAQDWDVLQEKIRALLALHNMHIHVDLIVGLPEEDMASFARSFNDVYDLHADMLQIGFLKFLKGAEMMRQVRSGDYRCMDTAPYEVLANRWMRYEEIDFLRILTDIYELYENAGRCASAISYLIECLTHGDAFDFYRRLTAWWIAHGYHEIGHKSGTLYAHLVTFAKDTLEASAADILAALDDRLRLDAIRRERGTIYPAPLHWTRADDFPAEMSRFWRGGGAAAVLDGFVFTNWHDVRKRYRIERFTTDLFGDGGARTTWILFDLVDRGIYDVTRAFPVDTSVQP